MKYFLGVDCGSVSVKLAVVNEKRDVLWTTYQRSQGDPLGKLGEVVTRMESAVELSDVDAFHGCFATGSGRHLVQRALGATVVNEITAHGMAGAQFYPSARTIIEIGGQDAKLILLDTLPTGEVVVVDSQMNDICAAGTGSFLDQQAFRMGMSIEELSSLACLSDRPAKVSAKCSVFAKTDLIHLQQEGVTKSDLVAGLCLAVARNYVENVVKGRTIRSPVLFQGGVANNAGVRQALIRVLALESVGLLVPTQHEAMGAIGAVLYGLKRMSHPIETLPRAILSQKIASARSYTNSKHLPILRNQEDIPRSRVERSQTDLSTVSPKVDKGVGLFGLSTSHRTYRAERAGLDNPVRTIGTACDVYLGVDVGSVSAKLAAIDSERNVLFTHYTPTNGRPIDAVKECFARFQKSIGNDTVVRGLGVTGSGRSMVASFLRADVVRNEITAQAAAAVHYVPDVNVIFEIGGQDSKYIKVSNGVVVDFVMNKTCAAGTGSFLAEQADRIGIDINDISNAALASKNPLDMGTRCTVFMETDCIHHQQAGAAREDILAGLSYSVAKNYLEKVVGGRPIDGNVVVQGGIAFNQSVVAAFETILGKKVAVAPFHEATGALGIALIVRDEANRLGGSNFIGFELHNRIRETNTKQCQDCANLCHINYMRFEDGTFARHGGICGKFEDHGNTQTVQSTNYFEERKRLLLAFQQPVCGGAKIGVPRALLFHELFPLWSMFFSSLGFDVVISRELSKQQHERGTAHILVDTCFPIRTVYGAVADLVDQGVDQVFLPYVANMKANGWQTEHNHNCQYVQQVADLVRASMPIDVVTHTVRLNEGEKSIIAAFCELGKALGATEAESKRAYRLALQKQSEFTQQCHKLGEQLIATLGENNRVLVLVGHSYVLHDNFLNMNLPARLRRAGIPVIPGDLLLSETADSAETFADLKWWSNNRAVAILQRIRAYNRQQKTRLLPVIMTQFGCAADSMLTPYLNDLLSDTPWLEVEVDEHNSGTGLMTRCEAFWDSESTKPECKAVPKSVPDSRKKTIGLRQAIDENRTIYILPFCDAASVIPDVLARHGVQSKLIPKTSAYSNAIGRRHSNEKHCRTYQVILGDLLTLAEKSDFVPDKSAIFMFEYDEACRLALFTNLFEKVLSENGAGGIKMLGTTVDDPVGWISTFGLGIATELWVALIAADYLSRLRYELRPYESVRGSVDSAYYEASTMLTEAIRKNKVMRNFRTCLEKISSVPRTNRSLVRIGVIGDAFTRVHQYGMSEIFNIIEEANGAILLPPSWHDFINYGAERRAQELWRNGRLLRGARTVGGSWTLNYLREKLQRVARDYSESFCELSNKELTVASAPYINTKLAPVMPSMFIGKSVDFASNKKVDGFVNAYGFNCCLGKITTACMSKVRAEYRGIPMVDFVDDGLQQTNTRTRIEAFMEQAWAFKRGRETPLAACAE